MGQRLQRHRLVDKKQVNRLNHQINQYLLHVQRKTMESGNNDQMKSLWMK